MTNTWARANALATKYEVLSVMSPQNLPKAGQGEVKRSPSF